MSIVGALDVHRRQITFDYLDSANGQVGRGRLHDPHRQRFREWLVTEFAGRSDVAFALEGCTGWRYVVEELKRAGIEAHLADPAEVQARRGRKRRAKTDRSDARLQRELLARGELPESWIPPTHVLEVRALIRCYKALLDDYIGWQQRMHAALFHHGVPEVCSLKAPATRQYLLSEADLSPAGRRLVAVGYRLLDALGAELFPLRQELAAFARRQVGCRALMAAHYGVGPLTAAAVWSEYGDCRRFANSDQAVRHTGLDVTVDSSDDKRRPGYLSRQGPDALRWLLFEAGLAASRKGSPDHAYFCSVRDRHDTQRAALSVARKLARRCYHTLRTLGETALTPVS
jgi:transposase